MTNQWHCIKCNYIRYKHFLLEKLPRIISYFFLFTSVNLYFVIYFVFFFSPGKQTNSMCVVKSVWRWGTGPMNVQGSGNTSTDHQEQLRWKRNWKKLKINPSALLGKFFCLFFCPNLYFFSYSIHPQGGTIQNFHVVNMVIDEVRQEPLWTIMFADDAMRARRYI